MTKLSYTRLDDDEVRFILESLLVGCLQCQLTETTVPGRNVTPLVHIRGCRDRIWQLDLQLHVQSVSISTQVVSPNLVHGEMCQIQHYVIKFVSDLRQVFTGYSTNKTNHHDITEILLKVALNTINQPNRTHYPDSEPTRPCMQSGEAGNTR